MQWQKQCLTTWEGCCLLPLPSFSFSTVASLAGESWLREKGRARKGKRAGHRKMQCECITTQASINFGHSVGSTEQYCTVCTVVSSPVSHWTVLSHQSHSPAPSLPSSSSSFCNCSSCTYGIFLPQTAIYALTPLSSVSFSPARPSCNFNPQSASILFFFFFSPSATRIFHQDMFN